MIKCFIILLLSLILQGCKTTKISSSGDIKKSDIVKPLKLRSNGDGVYVLRDGENKVIRSETSEALIVDSNFSLEHTDNKINPMDTKYHNFTLLTPWVLISTPLSIMLYSFLRRKGFI